MPGLVSPMAELPEGRKLTEVELIQAARSMMAAENESAQLYMQLAGSTDNKTAAGLFKDIADDERAHAGECLRLLRELSHEEDKFYAEAAAEKDGAVKKNAMTT